MNHIKTVLKIWGWLCIIFAVVCLGLTIYAASVPNVHFASGSTPFEEWLGTGLISLGLARVIELLEKK